MEVLVGGGGGGVFVSSFSLPLFPLLQVEVKKFVLVIITIYDANTSLASKMLKSFSFSIILLRSFDFGFIRPSLAVC